MALVPSVWVSFFWDHHNGFDVVFISTSSFSFFWWYAPATAVRVLVDLVWRQYIMYMWRARHLLWLSYWTRFLRKYLHTFEIHKGWGYMLCFVLWFVVVSAALAIFVNLLRARRTGLLVGLSCCDNQNLIQYPQNLLCGTIFNIIFYIYVCSPCACACFIGLLFDCRSSAQRKYVVLSLGLSFACRFI